MDFFVRLLQLEFYKKSVQSPSNGWAKSSSSRWTAFIWLNKWLFCLTGVSCSLNTHCFHLRLIWSINTLHVLPEDRKETRNKKQEETRTQHPTHVLWTYQVTLSKMNQIQLSGKSFFPPQDHSELVAHVWILYYMHHACTVCAGVLIGSKAVYESRNSKKEPENYVIGPDARSKIISAHFHPCVCVCCMKCRDHFSTFHVPETREKWQRPICVPEI